MRTHEQIQQPPRPGRLALLRSKIWQIETAIASSVKTALQSLRSSCASPAARRYFERVVSPALLSGLSYAMGEIVIASFGRPTTENDEYDFVVKFVIGSTILGYAAMNRLTDRQIKSPVARTVVASMELTAAIYTVSASFIGCRRLSAAIMPDNYSLLTSAATSAFIVPSALTEFAQRYQKNWLDKQHKKGSQRSDSVAVIGGLTEFGNIFFFTYYFLRTEFLSAYRLFHLGLIGENVLSFNRLVQQWRNAPSLAIGIAPLLWRNGNVQLTKIKEDYEKNTRLFPIIDANGKIHLIERHQLHNGDLVWCGGEPFNPVSPAYLHSVSPLAGKLFSYSQNEEKPTTAIPSSEDKTTVNYKGSTGEDIWKLYDEKEINSTPVLDSKEEIDPEALKKGKQAGVLKGTLIDFKGNQKKHLLQIMPKKPVPKKNRVEKISVIEQAIAQYKQKNIIFAIISSAALATFLGGDKATILCNTIRLLFSVFQMLLPYSEEPLRYYIVSKMMRQINNLLENMPIDDKAAMGIVDLFNALRMRYSNEFPGGVAVISDKTGTLTTNEMKVVGFYVSNKNQEEKYSDSEINTFFAALARIYTNRPGSEPEELAILNKFKSLLKNEQCLEIKKLDGNNHFNKIIRQNGQETSIETWHLGLYTKLCGRVTLVLDKGEPYLFFCGIPKEGIFKNTKLFSAYTAMPARTGVLSRDWCIASTKISFDTFNDLKQAFAQGNEAKIETIAAEHAKEFEFIFTALVDNPVKKGAGKFILDCRKVGIPVFIATGDSAKAANNIRQVFGLGETRIFSGVDEKTLSEFDDLLSMKESSRPNIIFADVTTEGKGQLARHLKQLEKKYFLLIIGDGENDVDMMDEGDCVVACLTDEKKYAEGVKPLANISDEQIRALYRATDESLFELLDFHKKKNSRFMNFFARLTNTQEKPLIALSLKSIKIGFELGKAIEATGIREIWQQHWWSVAFDIIWILLSAREIELSADQPIMEGEHVGRSSLPTKCMLITMAVATLESWLCYTLLGKSTDINLMIMILSFLPMLLSNLFGAYRNMQNEDNATIEVIEEEKEEKSPRGHTRFFDRLPVDSANSDEILANAAITRATARLS